MLFFLLEKLVLWRHCHTHDCEAHGMAAPMVLIGDAFHNFLDGVVIGTAVLTSVPLGVSTALAVATHEIPQELGDFAILLHAGYSRQQGAGAESRLGRCPPFSAPCWPWSRSTGCRAESSTSCRSRPRAFSTSRWPI